MLQRYHVHRATLIDSALEGMSSHFLSDSRELALSGQRHLDSQILQVSVDTTSLLIELQSSENPEITLQTVLEMRLDSYQMQIVSAQSMCFRQFHSSEIKYCTIDHALTTRLDCLHSALLDRRHAWALCSASPRLQVQARP